ncbi:MAG: hypothetical protein ACP5HQ_00325 [Thermoprotei archaeon]
MFNRKAYTTLALLLLAVPLLALGVIQGLAANNPGQANMPVITLTYVSSTPQFPVPVNNQGYTPSNAVISVNGQQQEVALQPYSYSIVNVSLSQGANVIQLGRERLLVTYNYSSNAVNPTAYINGSKQLIVVQNVRPGSYLYFKLTVSLPSNAFLDPRPPVTDMEVGPTYSAFFNYNPMSAPNVVNYAVYVPPGISQGLYQVYFPVNVVSYVEVSGVYVQQQVGFTWAVAFINVTYGLAPFSQTNSTKPVGAGELAQFVIPNFDATKTYYLIAGSQVYQIGPLTTSFNVYGYTGTATYYGSSRVEVAYSSNGVLVYVPNYQGPVSLSTSPTTTVTTTTTSTTTSTTTTATTTTSTTSTTTTSTTSTTTTTSSASTTTTATQSSTTSTTTTNTTTTTVIVPSTTTPVSSVTPSATTTSPSFPITYAVVGAVIVIVIVAAVALLLRK